MQAPGGSCDRLRRMAGSMPWGGPSASVNKVSTEWQVTMITGWWPAQSLARPLSAELRRAAKAPRCGASCDSCQADALYFEREGAGLALGDHEAGVTDAGGVECWRAGDLTAAEGARKVASGMYSVCQSGSGVKLTW